jgi:hypothetical protein
MAAENCLWGAPRIHGELLKLGIAVSERTVSRYLHGRPTTRSQTWRTFFANLLGDRTFVSPVRFADAGGDDIVIDASDLWSRLTLRSINAWRTFNHASKLDWGGSLQHSVVDSRLGHDHLQDRPGARPSTGRDPPQASMFRAGPAAIGGFVPACLRYLHAYDTAATKRGATSFASATGFVMGKSRVALPNQVISID